MEQSNGSAAVEMTSGSATVQEVSQEDRFQQKPLTFCERVKRLRVVLMLMFCIGFVAATPSSIIPQLQQDAFGNSSFTITGGFSAGKGALGCLIVPLYGSFSDSAGRRTALIIAEAVTILPYGLFLITGNFWVYSVLDMCLGFHEGTMTLLLATVADLVPVATGSHADSFALSTATFFLGISLAPFLGAFLDVKITFVCCCVTLLVAIAITWFFFTEAREASAPLLSPTTSNGPSALASLECEPVRITKQAHVARLLEAILVSRDLRLITLVVFANGLAESLLDSLLLLYLDNTLNFTATQQAIVIAILGVGSVFGLVAVTSVFRKHLGSLGTLRVELLANVVICALFSFITSTWGIYGVTALSVVGMGVFPCACAVAALTLEQSAAGLAQGVASAARMLSSGIGPALFGLLFQATENTAYPGASFLIASLCVLLAFLTTRLLAPQFSTKKL